MKTAFIGHRDFLPLDIETRLQKATQTVLDMGCHSFIMGIHGEFDKAALRVCKMIQATNPSIKIEVVVTNPRQSYPHVENVMFEIETLHYKQRIIQSNKSMIDESDCLICYVCPHVWRSGAKLVLNYAQKCKIKIINLYQLSDENF